jgi:signal transduction histidine kinase
MRVLGPLLTAAVTFAILRTEPFPGGEGRGLAVTLSLAGFVLGAFGTLYLERTSQAHVAAASALVAGSVTLMWTQSPHTGFVALFVALFLLARRLPARLAITLSAIAVGFLVLAGATSQRQSGYSGLLTALTIAGFAGLTMLTQQLREAYEQAENRLEELERTRAAEAVAAALAERQHLAREMHDVLAHSLSGLMLQLEAARLLANEHGGDPRLPEAIERAHRLGKSGLDEARRAIEMLRGENLPGPSRLAALAERCADDLGIPCRYTVVGEPIELAAQARLTLYRSAQEALTNIAKHAGCPKHIELILTYAEDGATLTVEDSAPIRDGTAEKEGTVRVGMQDDTGEPAGYGLTGMRERAELLGGSLEASPTDTGFLVRVHVPAAPADR